MVSWKTISDCALVVFSCIVLLRYLIQRAEYMESYFEYKMDLCVTDAQKIAQLENWDADSKFDPPPFKTHEEWDAFWTIHREKAFYKYRHIFADNYVPPYLRENKIILTGGGKYMTFDD
uniref:Methyltranfer_dom domain-containing protein n=1 Tax=Caenorhabditis tropicalis TaxID=1561998 RepID=A0A1I7T1Y8_9PELO